MIRFVVTSTTPVVNAGMDPALTYSELVLSENNELITRTVETVTGGASLSFTTFTTGRRYFEVECVTPTDMRVGWADDVTFVSHLDEKLGNESISTGWETSTQRMYMNGSYNATIGSEPTTNDIVMCCYDAEQALVWWGLNGTWFTRTTEVGRPDIGLYLHRSFSTDTVGTTMHAAISVRNNSVYRVKLADDDMVYGPPSNCYSLVDTIPTPVVPTYNALDPDKKSPAVILFDGNETFSRGRTWASKTYSSILAKYGNTGKRYFEVKKSINEARIGVALSTHDTTTYVGDGCSVAWETGTRQMWANGSWSAFKGTAAGEDDIIMVAFDTATGNIWWGLNGTWFSGNPATGTDPHRTIACLIGETVYPAVSVVVNSYYHVYIRASQFTYTPPTGFSEFPYLG